MNEEVLGTGNEGREQDQRKQRRVIKREMGTFLGEGKDLITCR